MDGKSGKKNIDKIFKARESTESVLDYFLKLIKSKNKFVFRGESCAEDVYPTIMRVDDGQNFISEEWELLNKFEKYGANYYHVYSPMDFLACAQHYGLPTRLLDFSYNPLVALAFTLHGDSPDNDYYTVRFCKLDDNMLLDNVLRRVDMPPLKNQQYKTLTEQTKILIEHMTGQSKKREENKKIDKHDDNQSVDDIYVPPKNMFGKLMFVETSQSNQRIIVQQGLFMLPLTLDRDDYLNMLKESTKVVKIHKSLRNDLNKELAILGCDMFHLMPDLSSICTNIKREVMMDIGKEEHGM